MRYLYYTIQTLRRGRTSSFIKLLSLTLGLLVGVLLFAQIAYELNYERCYPESERLVMVRCAMYDEDSGARRSYGSTPYDLTVFDVMAPTLAEEMPEWVETASTIGTFGGQMVYYNDKQLVNTRYIMADTAFFQTLGIEVLEGNRRDMGQENTVFLSQSFAKQVFGDESPIGRELTLDKQDRLTVRGIYRDMPDNTFLGRYEFVRSIHAGGGYINGGGWRGNDMFYAILRLRHAEDIDAVNANIDRVFGRHMSLNSNGWDIEYRVISLPDLHNQGFYMPQQPIALVAGAAPHVLDVRLRQPYDENLGKLNAFVQETFPDLALHFISVEMMLRDYYHGVSHFRNSVLLTSVFIILIVLMGLIGYVNDETGRRSKEIALRKVNGATAGDILRLLSRGVLLIAVPCVAVGSVVAWYVGTEWLTQFAGQVSISLLHFVGLAVLLLVVIVCIVVVKAWRIANENPVKSIKSE